jgi:hypothetical protein
MASVFRRIPTRSAQGRLLSLSLEYIQTPRNDRLSVATKIKKLSGLFKQFLKDEFGRVFFPQGRINTRAVLERVVGFLLVQSLNGRAARMNNINANDITPDAIQDILESSIQQSNGDETLETLEWTFFPNQDIYIVGGAGTIKSKYTKNLYHICYTEYEDEQGPISCAAFALNYRIHYHSKKYLHKDIKVIKKDARALQTKLGWSRYVGISDLESFVKHFPQYRLCILKNTNGNFRDTTFEGASFDSTILSETVKKMTSVQSTLLYIVFDFQHYFPVSSPGQYFRYEKGNKDLLFCHHCVEVYPQSRVQHECSDWVLSQQPARKIQVRLCEFCNQRYMGVCSCRTARCHYCQSVRRRGEPENEHRCILYKTPERPASYEFYTGGDQDGKKVGLWAYDIESRVHITEIEVQQDNELIAEFDLDAEEYFTGDVKVFNYDLREHKANLLVVKNVFTDEQHIFKGDDCLKEFLYFITTFNRGNNICYAHNGSGYDTRLIFDQAVQMEFETKKPIMRGCKFLKFTLGNVKFHDTLLHLQGSLRGLAKEYCSHVQLEKGYFPHLFNSVDHYDYVGAIPDKKYFELPFVIKDDAEWGAFHTWYDTWQGRDDWNFMNELEKYCVNDVVVLAEIMKSHHTILTEKFSMSPWFNTTAPGYVHEVYLRRLAMTLELPDPKEDPEGHKQRIQELATKEYWAVLKQPEYDFARLALRGGRTEIRKVFHRVSDEEWARGVRIRYQDICSQYPYQQAVHDFPVGTPTMYIWDMSMKPVYHENMNIVTHHPIPTKEELLRHDWFGIVCATMDPPKNMYHPVLVHFDQEMGKSVASCCLIEKGVFTSIEFQKALEMGYTLVTLHRFDKYHRKHSLWSDVIKDLFIEKMVNSGPLPSPENQQRLKQAYENGFGMGDDLQKTFDEHRWEKNPAKKKTFKIMLNSGWGKHAQRQNLVQTTILHQETHLAEQRVLFDNFSSNRLNLKQVFQLNEKETMYRYDRGDVKPDLHDTYIPAGLFVPAYGRLHLWEQLHRLGDRVLMNDTDSIVYIYDPEQYNIPEGDVWGEWEVEDIDSRNGGIREFVGVGPKTYSILCANGVTQTKCKGLSIKRAMEELVNHETMKSLVVDEEGKIRQEQRKFKVPQQTFVYVMGKGIHTRKMLKDLAFNPDDLKGELDEKGNLYPFGWSNCV